MGKMLPIALGDGSYDDDSHPFDSQECINYIPESAETPDARSRSILRGVPGLKTLGSIGANANIRGAHNVENGLYVVADSTLYKIETDYSVTAKGTIPGAARVSMAHNQVAEGNQLVIMTGAAGYVFDTTTDTLTQITDEGFPGSIAADYIDSYILGLDPYGQYFFNSNLADALSYDATNRYQASASPDKIVGILVNHQEAWVFGARTTQIFTDVGPGNYAGASPADNILFQSSPGTLVQKGCASRQSIAALDNSIIWLGDDGTVYRANGYTPVRVSTHAVEQDIARSTLGTSYAMVWNDRGHKVYYLTFEDGKTWGYDAATGKWHRRVSYGLDKWRVAHLTYWAGQWIAFDAFDGTFYALDWNTHAEGDKPLVATRRIPFITNNRGRLFMAAFELIMDTGYDTITGPGAVAVRYSDDGGKTYANPRSKLLRDIHQRGDRVRFNRLGAFRDRVLEVSVSAPVRRDLIAAFAHIEGS